MSEYTNNSITSWAEEDRPREKLLQKGAEALTDAELLAILLGKGSRGETAVGLAQRILKSAGNSLHELGRKTVKDFQAFKGMGEAKAVTIAAALELGRRRQVTDTRTRPRLINSADTYNVIAPFLSDLHHEEFWILLLNRACELIGKERHSIGGSAGTVVEVKSVMKIVLDARAATFIAIHNHPSGNLEPSKSDIALTQRLKEAGAIMDVPLADHLIVSTRGYFSFADEEML